MMFVFATHGTAVENAWAYAKARFDAESWWYRGNGAVDLLADAEFDPAAEPDRGIVLYGNADNNSAWPALLAQSPVQVHRAESESASVNSAARIWPACSAGRDRAVIAPPLR